VENIVSEFTIVAGDVQGEEVFRVIAFIDQLREKNSTSCGVYKHDSSDDKWVIFNLDWSGIGLSVIREPDVTLVIISEFGNILLAGRDNYKIITVSPGLEGPEGYGPLREIYAIGSSAYIVGMSRQIYRISYDGSWEIFEEGIVRPSLIKDVCGFNAIHGVSEKLLYVVGFNGEIWVNEGGGWRQVESPTNVVLNCVRVMKSGNVFIGGQNGILLEGSEGLFLVKETGVDEDIWSMDSFNNALYFCTEKKLFVINDNKVSRVDVGVNHDVFRSIRSQDNVICIFGPKIILKSRDGKKWKRISL